MAEHLLPALCDRCGSIWTPNAIAVGAGATNIRISNVSVGPCPACGSTGHIPDGVYEGTESGVRLVARLTPNHRRLLAEVFRDAQRQNSDQDTLARALESLATGQDDSSAAIRELAGEVRRLRAADWKYWLLVLLTALQVIGGVLLADTLDEHGGDALLGDGVGAR